MQGPSPARMLVVVLISLSSLARAATGVEGISEAAAG
jgi:hypothetical protein